MKLEGNIVKVYGDKVVIKQFYTGYTYEFLKADVKIKARNGELEKVNGKLIGRVDGIPEIYMRRIFCLCKNTQRL